MFLIVGLGNPGKKYVRTRHNLGYRALNLVCQKWKEKYGFPEWKTSSNQKAHLSRGKIKNKKVILAKPSTFINRSGLAVKSLVKTYNLSPRSLFIVHDDIDISLGKIKISKDRGAAGHKGVQSIIDRLGTKKFVRFRIGIYPQNQNQNLKVNKDTEEFVLQRFGKKENKTIESVLQKIPPLLEQSILKGVKKAQSLLGNIPPKVQK